jgi:5-formyltetrahydrofolate cyclo-ligase
MSPDDRSRLSDRVRARVEEMPEYAGASSLASYVAKRDEVETRGIIRDALSSGKAVSVPRTQEGGIAFYRISGLSDLSTGSFGVMEPGERLARVSLDGTQLVLVPVVAWDDAGNRLGHGSGLYDRALADRGGSFAAGLAFESQRSDRLPATPKDMPLDAVVTEERVVRFRRAVS